MHNNVQQFFQDIELKKPSKDRIAAGLSDYMIWQPDTGHRLVEGLEMMMTEERFRMLFGDIFKNSPEVCSSRSVREL